MKGKKDHKLRNTVLWLIIMAPVLTFLMALGTSKLILSEILPETSMYLCALIAVGVSSFLLSLFCSIRAPQKKILWALATGILFSVFLFLCNLMFFGVGFGKIWPTALMAIGSGMLAGIFTAIKRRRYA